MNWNKAAKAKDKDIQFLLVRGGEYKSIHLG